MIHSTVVGVSRVQWYYSRIAVENLRDKRSIEPIIGFGGIIDLKFGRIVNLLTQSI